jgi:hypothetical protein
MKYLFTKLLIMIAPTFVLAKSLDRPTDVSSPFTIKAEDIQFLLNLYNPELPCYAPVSLEASIQGSSICSVSNMIFYHIEIDRDSDGKIDMVASSDVDHHFVDWTLDTDDNVLKLYLSPENKSDYIFKLPVFKQEKAPKSGVVYWSVSDLCGYSSKTTSTFRLIDRKAPTPYCVSISTALLNSNPALNVFYAIDFDKGAFDNCTPSSELKFAFDGVAPIKNLVNEEHFYKAGANGSVLATQDEYIQNKAYKWHPNLRSASRLWLHSGRFHINIDVWDSDWNSDYCTVVINMFGYIEENFIFGKVKNIKEEGLENAFVTIEVNPFSIEFPKTINTNKNGDFRSFVSRIDLILSAYYNKYNNEYITEADFTILMQHLSGVKPFTYYWQYIAADLNEDRVVDQHDLWALRKLFLNMSSLPNWKVIVEDESLGNENWSNYSEKFFLSASTGKIDFIAIQLGDLDGEKLNIIDKIFDVNINPEVELRNKTLYYRNDIISTSPNPFNTNSLLVYSLEQAQDVKLRVFATNGLELFTTIVYGNTGLNTFDINETMCPQEGIYFVTIEGDFGIKSTKIIKIR